MRLPKGYWPNQHMRFMVKCGWLWAAPIGHSTLTITKDGYLYITSKSANTSQICNEQYFLFTRYEVKSECIKK